MSWRDSKQRLEMLFQALSHEKKTYIVSVFGLNFFTDIYNNDCKHCNRAEDDNSLSCPKIEFRLTFSFWATENKVKLFTPEEDSFDWAIDALLSSCPYDYRTFVKFRRKYIISKYYKQIADAQRIFTPDERTLLIDVFDHDDEYMRMVMHVLRTL